MYKAYEQKSDDPETKAFRYMLFLSVCFLLPFFLIVESTLKKVGIINGVAAYGSKIMFWLLLGLGVIFCHFAFNKQALIKHENEFDQHAQLNKLIKTWMFILLPLLVLVIGITTHLILFGGTFLQNKIHGLI